MTKEEILAMEALDSLVQTDEFKALTLDEQSYCVIRKTPINLGGHIIYLGGSSSKLKNMIGRIMELIKAKSG